MNETTYRHVFTVAKVGQIKDLSTYSHPRWKIKQHEPQRRHEFNDNLIKNLRVKEDSRIKKEGESAEETISFNSILKCRKGKEGRRQDKGLDGYLRQMTYKKAVKKTRKKKSQLKKAQKQKKI